MKPLYIVKVDDSRRPILPDWCLVCGRSGNRTPIQLVLSDEQGRVDFYLYKLTKVEAQGEKLTFPVHDACAKAVRNASLTHFALILLAVGLAVGVGMVIKNDIVSVVLALLVGIPLVNLELSKPMPVNFVHFRGSYVLMFRDHDIAEAVARLNGSKVEQDGSRYAEYM